MSNIKHCDGIYKLTMTIFLKLGFVVYFRIPQPATTFQRRREHQFSVQQTSAMCLLWNKKHNRIKQYTPGIARIENVSEQGYQNRPNASNT